MGMLNQAKGIRDDLWAMIFDAEQLTKMKPPADEPASKAFNVLAAGGGGNPGAFGYGVGHIKREHGYVDELIKRLEDALHLTHSSDENAATDMNKTGSSNGGGFKRS
ncbi:hypothetical protein [Amycolatopsis panacis]|uniref:Uncharacterized protein n=1 Tax=Amycolatopsis panacis TaxID=2340917 RepID=A0A419IAJ9_9PSEU|nr:hypothetical protein [Amycolatopsis panacis]RJQ90420.1 hypothetical protein D5S19_03160 [Amycolatopsis panacis]